MPDCSNDFTFEVLIGLYIYLELPRFLCLVDQHYSKSDLDITLRRIAIRECSFEIAHSSK